MEKAKKLKGQKRQRTRRRGTAESREGERGSFQEIGRDGEGRQKGEKARMKEGAMASNLLAMASKRENDRGNICS